jgi:hypothetical protein
MPAKELKLRRAFSQVLQKHELTISDVIHNRFLIYCPKVAVIVRQDLQDDQDWGLVL